ncbi:MAG: aminoglycoside phosphotransferase family protein, partial [Gammaproteobacteria bacterium]|nr:aminoglycoside phosphotransferase family protein [Gammaproteobacteria bacterium]
SRREYRNQMAAHELAPRHVPRPLGTFEIGALTVVCTEVVGGRHLTRSRDQFRHFARIADCLLGLHKAGAEYWAALAPARERLSDVYSKFSELDGSARLRDYAAQCRRRSRDVSALLPSIPQHGDFRYMNVLIDKHSVGILDWEYYGACSMPCYDLLCLLLDAFFCESPQLPCDADSAVKFSRDVHTSVQRYFDALSIPVALAEPLIEWTLFQQFVSSVERGESSQKKFLDRIVLYRDNVSRSRDLLTALLPQE